VAEKTPESERRGTDRGDRRKHSRSGRRASDPHVNWRRLTWVFAGYALYLSIRSLPDTVRRLLRRRTEA
jgi:hypothetical protein